MVGHRMGFESPSAHIMAKLAELVALKANNSTLSAKGEEWCVKFAYALNMGMREACAIFEENGAGYIYTPGGIVVRDSEKARERMMRAFGRCVVVSAEGEMQVIYRKVARAIERGERRLRHRRERISEAQARRMEADERRAMREADRMHHQGMTHPCPKHQGKADGLGDLGKYAWNPRRSVTDAYHTITWEGAGVTTYVMEGA